MTSGKRPKAPPAERSDQTILGVGDVADTQRESDATADTLPPFDIEGNVLGADRTILGQGAVGPAVDETAVVPPPKEGTPPNMLETKGAARTALPRPCGPGTEVKEPDFAPRPRYAPQKSLGEGAMGAVDLARDNDIERQVAIKWLKASPNDTDMVLRFADEVRLVGQLEHPNIVPVHDVGRTDDGRYYFVMKYVEGETLEAVIKKLAAGDPSYHAKYTFEYRAKIFHELLRAMEFAHEKGIVHRDIKPANIMVGPLGEVMVMDWGIAKQLGEVDGEPPDLASTLSPDELVGESGGRLSTTARHAIMGTPLYMAPEQTRPGRDVDQRADIYSLCAVLYELLTLNNYLERKSSVPAMLAAVREEKPKFPTMTSHRHQSSVPADLSHFVVKGLAKAPADRYQSIAEMRQLLKRRDDGYVAVQCPMTFSKRVLQGLSHLIDRHPMLTVMVLMGTLGAAIFGVYRLITTLA